MRFAVLAALTLSACATAPPVPEDIGPVATIEDVIAHHHEWDGQRLKVQGWVTRCETRDCGLLAKRRGDYDDPHLAIGTSASFDTAVRRLAGRKIVVEATLDATCIHSRADPPVKSDSIFVCADRVNELADPTLITVIE